MPILAVVGDVHANPRYDHVLGRLRAARAEGALDGVLFVGDLGWPDIRPGRRADEGRRLQYVASVRSVLGDARALGVPIAWVPGNHDMPRVGDSLGDLAASNADGRVVDVAGVRVHGIGGAGPDRFGFAYEWDEDDIRARAAPECDVLLCHTPPRHTPLDLTWGGREHVGSDAIRERAERHRGVLVCGHIHESPDAVLLNECLCLNAGGLGEPFGRAQVAWICWDASGAGEHELVHEDLGDRDGLASRGTRRWRRGDLERR